MSRAADFVAMIPGRPREARDDASKEVELDPHARAADEGAGAVDEP
jgi:hypothetical protein